MVTRKIPIRKCIACGVQRPKKELIRIVRTPELDVRIDPKGKMNGRGAYICPLRECFDLAIKRKSITRALEIELTAEKIGQLQQEWSDVVHE